MSEQAFTYKDVQGCATCGGRGVVPVGSSPSPIFGPCPDCAGVTVWGRNPGERALPDLAQMTALAERLIGDVDALDARRNLAVYEQDARLIARWLLALAALAEQQQADLENAKGAIERLRVELVRVDGEWRASLLREARAENGRLRAALRLEGYAP